MTKTTRRLSTSSKVIAGAAITGFLLGGTITAVASPSWFAPAGLSSTPSGNPAPAKVPDYAKNASGQSYGSALKATSPEAEPGLIQVDATNGRTGYAKKSELAAAEGTGFTSIEEAVKWSEGEGRKDHTVPVYLSDGTTRIGVFIVHGTIGHAEKGTAANRE